jgi:hypothetical protein
MTHPQPAQTRCRKLTVALLLAVMACGYLLVRVHASEVHGSTAAADTCAVCAWAKSLATIGSSPPGIPLVRPAGRVAACSQRVARPFSYPRIFSARSPPVIGLITWCQAFR